jgi:type II secretory pathway component PulC
MLFYQGALMHPLWIVNSSMLIVLFFALIFSRWSSVETPTWESIAPRKYNKPSREPAVSIAADKIFENDLFDTYKKEVVPEKPAEKEVTFPDLPTQKSANIPAVAEPQFLDPLNITLKGIVIIGYNPTKNSALILDNKTNVEKVYYTGSSLEDAILIKILSNKIIFLRSNGQQEVLYLRSEDASKEMSNTAALSEWSTIIKAQSNDTYVVDPKLFVTKITNLAQFIELLHLTTVYEEGKPLGCRIGNLEDHSVGTALGLAKGDLITAINDIPTGPSKNRMEIFQQIKELPQDGKIEVYLLRNNRPKTLTITLRSSEQSTTPALAKDIPLQKQTNDEKMSIIKEKYQLAPTIQDIRKRERQHMLEHSAPPKKTRSLNDEVS